MQRQNPSVKHAQHTQDEGSEQTMMPTTDLDHDQPGGQHGVRARQAVRLVDHEVGFAARLSM
jgi:hypothetical protein